MGQTTRTFQELLDAARQGEPAAALEIAQQYEGELKIVASLLLGRPMRHLLDSMDLVQSVHKSLLFGLRHDKFDISSPQKLVALAVRMLRNKLAKKWRKDQRQLPMPSGGSDAGAAAPEWLLAGRDQDDPARVAQLNDLLDYLHHQLRPWEWQVVELRWQEFSNEEIAAKLGMDPDNLRAHRSLLKRRLKAKGVLADWL